MTEIARLAAAIETIAKYLARAVAKGDREGMLKWSLRSADYSTRFAVLVSPHAALVEREFADLNPIEKAPDFGDSDQMSGALYGDWVTAWVQKRFPEAYRDWPPTVHAISPQALASAATEDGCLAQVTAAGVFGVPDTEGSLGDFRLFTALASTTLEGGMFIHKVWRMGKLVGSRIGGPDDGLDFAHSLGFNW